MQKTIRWTISVFTAGGLLLAGTAAARHNNSPASRHAVLAAVTGSQPAVNLDNCPTLAEGYQGGCVNQLQSELNTDDNAGLPVDGTFGPLTQQAVINFQQGNGIVPADGIVGPQTKAALDQHNSAGIQPVPNTPGGNPGKEAIRVCGHILTCSIYYSHQATVQLADALDQSGVVGTANNEAAVCGIASIPFVALLPGCAPLVAAAFAAQNVKDIIDHAAATAGCVRFRSLNGLNNGPNAVYADHSSICHSMDPAGSAAQ